MAELTTKERLQPSLLDRLTDDEPENSQESRDTRVFPLHKLRQYVLRDMAWLLNTGACSSHQSLEPYPFVQHSVINYGIPELTGSNLTSTDALSIERRVRQAILDFEPRILPASVKVKVTLAEGQMNRNAMRFDIEGDLWAQPMPLRLYMSTELDLETGNMNFVSTGA